MSQEKEFVFYLCMSELYIFVRLKFTFGLIGDLPQRICTAAELRFYFSNFIAPSSFLQPNRNCNHSSWISGCEPGWACRTGSTQPIDFRESSEIPSRTSHCQSCCEGFFCPQGLTCMIRKSFSQFARTTYFFRNRYT